MAIDVTSTANLGYIVSGTKVVVGEDYLPYGVRYTNSLPVFTVRRVRLNEYHERVYMVDLEYEGVAVGSAALAACTLVEDSTLNLKELVWE